MRLWPAPRIQSSWRKPPATVDSVNPPRTRTRPDTTANPPRTPKNRMSRPTGTTRASTRRRWPQASFEWNPATTGWPVRAHSLVPPATDHASKPAFSSSSVMTRLRLPLAQMT